MSLKLLSSIIGKPKHEIKEALSDLEKKLEGRGIRIVQKEDKVFLGTAPKASGFIEGLIKEELDKDLGKAGLETLSIILYNAPVSRPEIDYLRGVNSTFILRNLTIRGLVERVKKTDDQRSYLYKPSLKLLSFLGLGKVEELPEYGDVRRELEDFKNKKEKNV